MAPLVYPYPSLSDLAGGYSDHGLSKTRTKTPTTPDCVFTSERRNSDHGLSFWGGKSQTAVWVWGVFGVGVDEGDLKTLISLNKESRPFLLGDLGPPYCAIPRDYLSDSPLLRAMGFWCLNMANWVRYPLQLFWWVFPPWRACEVEVQ